MIVIGADPHKRTHTLVAVAAATGEQRSCETVPSSTAGSDRALQWARGLGSERVWAIEDCRHVSGRFERFLVARGERVVRVPPKLMAGARRSARQPGKSDPIDALCVARAALREGLETLPAAHLDDRALEIRLLLDHHDDLVAHRSTEQRRLRWHLHDLFGELDIPAGALDREVWLTRLSRRLARQQPSVRVRIARELISSIRQATKRVKALEREIHALVGDYAPQLLDEVGCGPLTAAKLVGEIAGAERFSTDAKMQGPLASRRSRSHRVEPTAFAWTVAATANSTARCTASPSTKANGTPPAPPTSPANRPKARPAWKPSAASNATSPAASGTSSTSPPRPRRPLTRRSP